MCQRGLCTVIQIQLLAVIALVLAPFSADAASYKTKTGKTFQGTYLGVGVGAVGFHRSRSELKVCRTFYTGFSEGIYIEAMDKRWMDFDDFVKSYDRQACIFHVINYNKPSLGSVEQTSYETSLKSFLKKPAIINTMKKNGTQNVWFYCRLAKFRLEDGYIATIPLDFFAGTAHTDQFERAYNTLQQNQREYQLRFLGEDIETYTRARLQIYQAAPTTPFGPDWTTVSPFSLRGQYVINMQKRMAWEMTTIRYRMMYLAILDYAK